MYTTTREHYEAQILTNNKVMYTKSFEALPDALKHYGSLKKYEPTERRVIKVTETTIILQGLK